MDDASVVPARHKLSVDEYHRLGDAGIFAEDEGIEPIDGDLIDTARIGHEHAAAVGGLNEALTLAWAGQAFAWLQNPIRLHQSSEPQPDWRCSGCVPTSIARLIPPPRTCCSPSRLPT